MASYYRTLGIVLGKEDRGEADLVFTVFTKDFGKVRLRAVSARKITSKLRAGLGLFYCAEIAFVQGKTHKTIIDAVLLERYRNLRADIMRMRVAYRLAEIAGEIVKGQEKDGRIWNLLQETFLFLNRPTLTARARSLLAYYFLWNLLAMSGYSPSLREIAARDEKTARVIANFLDHDTRILQHMQKQGINENLLREVSKEHLFKIEEG